VLAVGGDETRTQCQHGISTGSSNKHRCAKGIENVKRAISDIRIVLQSVQQARHALRKDLDRAWRGESPDYLRGVEDALSFVAGGYIISHFDDLIARSDVDSAVADANKRSE
jgi:hypothetical protein